MLLPLEAGVLPKEADLTAEHLRIRAPDGKPIVVKYGEFIQTIIDFVIIAFVLFMALKGINKLKKPAPTAAPPPPPREEVLLEEIRDLLKKQAAAR